MTRLDKMENLYLNILRVTILILATAFLVGATFGLITALPKLIPALGGADARALVNGATFKDYRDSRQSTASGVTADTTSTAGTTTDKIDSRIATASQNFVAWGTKVGGNFNLGAVEHFLDGKQKSLSEPLQGDYADSLVQFSRDVLASAGSGEDINQLIEWHLAKFSAAQAQAAEAEQAKTLKTAVERQQALVLAGAAAAAFLAFLILVFVFVLVKIERNLRIVVVQGAGDRAP
jgi:hypothetical protein